MDLVFDIETNGLLNELTKLHCIAILDTSDDSTELYAGSEERLLEGIERLNQADVLIGHNIATFDIPALFKLYPKEFSPKGTLIDTLLLNCILNPEEGTKSLEDWAISLGLSQQKVQNEDWSVYTEHMGRRCVADVVINVAVYRKLRDHPQVYLVPTALRLETDVALIHSQQIQNKVGVDVPKAKDLYVQLSEELIDIREKLVKLGPSRVLIPRVPAKSQEVLKKGLLGGKEAFRKSDGQYTVSAKNYFSPAALKTLKGPYNPIEIKEFNPDSSEEVRDLLLELGWQPTEYNRVKDKSTGEWRVTSPKLTEDSFSSLPAGLGQAIARYNTLSHRRNFLRNISNTNSGLIPTAEASPDHRVPAEAFTCATPTARYRHSGVVCNIPRVTTLYGREIRSLFWAGSGYKQVGIDLSGIEARVLAHYLLAGNYPGAQETADLILTGDFHTANAELWQVSRNTSKSILYALMYGAGPAKLAAIAGIAKSKGEALKRKFYKKHPAIEHLIKDLTTAYKRNGGYIKAWDGRPLFVRREGTLLNTLLQNIAALVFKNWMVKLHEARAGNPCYKDVQLMIAYHDELQYRVPDEGDLPAHWGTTCELAAMQVGKDMKLLVPIQAEAKVGWTWADCH